PGPGRLQVRHRLGPPDPLLRPRPVAHQGSAHRRRAQRLRQGAGRRSGRIPGSQPQAGSVTLPPTNSIEIDAKTMSDQQLDQNELQQEENKLIAQRKEKLAAIRQQGNAFPNDFRRDSLCADLQKQYEGKSKEELEAAAIPVKVA